MLVKIIADENIDAYIIESLRNENYEVLSIRESYKGIKDIEIIVMANEKECLILTEDKDFGEWIFSHKSESAGVIFLRYEDKDKEEMVKCIQRKKISFHRDDISFLKKGLDFFCVKDLRHRAVIPESDSGFSS